MILSLAVLGFVTLLRLGELVYARANTRRLLAQGGHEVGAGHYPLIVVMHAAWLIGLWVLAWNRSVSLPWLGVFVLIEIARAWMLASIGRRWTTRIIIVPGETLVRKGPYRFFPHPNYAVVAAEIFVLPVVFGLWWFAALFTVLNAGVLFIRIRAENSALDSVRA
ncbi:MAG TPA: isoprenylcysteine carboxylmethyltransferase family protein [Caulobacteraceae bacterium]|jgi:methyltransferase|nr:isoprenylcysteine carboxylmethyltransferase family protein [Caulobacteraceae bacterium]